MIFTCWIIWFLYFRFLYIYFGGNRVDWDSVLWWKLFYLSLHYTLSEDTPKNEILFIDMKVVRI